MINTVVARDALEHISMQLEASSDNSAAVAILENFISDVEKQEQERYKDIPALLKKEELRERV